MKVSNILVVEVIDRDVIQVLECKTQDEAVQKANELLKYRCGNIGFLDEFESGKDENEKWQCATDANLRAWCNYDGEHWDAHVAIIDGDGQCLACVKNAHAANVHACPYCGKEAAGSDKDILCNDCAAMFGHYRYSQL